MDVIKLNCINCGAPVKAEEVRSNGSYTCPFCGSNQIFLEFPKADDVQMLTGDYQVQVYVPGLEDELPLRPPVLTGQWKYFIAMFLGFYMLFLVPLMAIYGTDNTMQLGEKLSIPLGVGAFIFAHFMGRRRKKKFNEKHGL